MHDTHFWCDVTLVCVRVDALDQCRLRVTGGNLVFWGRLHCARLTRQFLEHGEYESEAGFCDGLVRGEANLDHVGIDGDAAVVATVTGVSVELGQCADPASTVFLVYTRLYPTSENYIMNIHHWPGRTRVIDSRQLIPFTFLVQTGQLASPVNMMILTMVG